MKELKTLMEKVLVEVDKMEFECRLKYIFLERKIKQTEFAKQIGISSSAMSGIANGKSYPTFKVAYKISEALNMDIKEIWVKK